MTYEELEHIHDDCDFALEVLDEIKRLNTNIGRIIDKNIKKYEELEEDVSRMKVEYINKHPKIQRNASITDFLNYIDGTSRKEK